MGRQVAHQGHPPGQEHHVHLPDGRGEGSGSVVQDAQRQADARGRLRPGVAGVAHRVHRPERRGQVDAHQGARRRDEARRGLPRGLPPPELPHRLRGAARVPPHRAAPRDVARRVHPVALLRRPRQGAAGHGGGPDVRGGKGPAQAALHRLPQGARRWARRGRQRDGRARDHLREDGAAQEGPEAAAGRPGQRHLPELRTIKQLIGRRTRHGDYEYEVKWGDKEMVSMDPKNNLYVPKVVLETHGFHKLMKAIDDKIAAEAGNVKPLTTTAIQRHLDDFGLHEEFGTYGKMKNLSGGQKVKCVIGASMWFCPHIVVLDEPTNYLDRDSLGALSRAIKEFQGGVLMISHNAEFFGDIAPEVWEVPGDQKVHVSGAEWMEAIRAKELAEQKAKKKSIPKQDEEKFDALGNKIETVTAAADVDRDMIKRMTKQLKALKDRIKKGDASCEDEMYEVEAQLEEAKAALAKEKAAAKAEKEAAKKLNAKPKKEKKAKK